MTAPQPVFLLYLQDQIFYVFLYRLSTGRFVLVCPEILNKPTLPLQKRRWFHQGQMIYRFSGQLENHGQKKSITSFQ